MMKRKSSLKLPSKRKIKGIILSTEMILLLTAVIMFAVVTFFGISKMVLQQANSSKETLVIVRAEAWKISGGVAVSLYLQNTGSESVQIDEVGVKYYYYPSLYTCYTTITVTINPGESKVLSFALGPGLQGVSGNCDNLAYLSAGSTVYVYAKTSTDNEVGTAAKLTAP